MKNIVEIFINEGWTAAITKSESDSDFDQLLSLHQKGAGILNQKIEYRPLEKPCCGIAGEYYLVRTNVLIADYTLEGVVRGI